MGLQLIIFAGIMLFLTLLNSLSGNRNTMLKKRKQQSTNNLRENVLKKRLEQFTEQKVRYSRRYAVETLCLQAGYHLSYTEYLFISATSAVVTAVFISLLMKNMMLGAFFLVVGYLIPRQFITFMKNRRVGLMEKQIGSFINMVLVRYESTKDFGKAMELSMGEFLGQEPLYSEIRQAVLEIHLGKPVHESLDGMARRTGNRYLARLSDYYKIASEIGTDDARKKMLGQALEQFEENRKAKSMMKRELATVKREAYIMVGAIPLFIVWQISTNPDYIHFMTTDSTGKIGSVVIVAIFMGCIWFINNKISAPLD